MSRIVRGGSEEVREMRTTSQPATARQGNPYNAPQFKMLQSSGTFTQAELDVELQKAIQKARLDAVKETEQKLKQPLSGSLDNLNNILDELSKFRRELFKESESEILTLIQALSKRIFARELKLDSSLLSKLIQDASEAIHKEYEIEIRLSPADIKEFQSIHPEVLKPSREGIRIIPDGDVARGEASVLSSHKKIDVRIEKIVEDIVHNVLDQKSEIGETGDEGDKV